MLVPGHPQFARVQSLVPGPNDDARILTNRQATQHGLDSTKQFLGVLAKEEDGRLLGSLPSASIGTLARGSLDVADNRFKVEAGIHLVRQTDAVQVYGQTLLRAELTKNASVGRIEELRSLRRTGGFESLYNDIECRVEIGEFEFDVRVSDASRLVELRASTSDAPHTLALQNCLKRVLVPVASINGLNVFVNARENGVWKRHRGFSIGSVCT